MVQYMSKPPIRILHYVQYTHFIGVGQQAPTNEVCTLQLYTLFLWEPDSLTCSYKRECTFLSLSYAVHVHFPDYYTLSSDIYTSVYSSILTFFSSLVSAF